MSDNNSNSHMVSNIDYKYVKYLEFFVRNEEVPV